MIAFRIELWAAVSCLTVLECPPVRTMFPFAVHLAEDVCICTWVECLRALFTICIGCEGVGIYLPGGL